MSIADAVTAIRDLENRIEQIEALPEKFTQLEARVAALEGKPSGEAADTSTLTDRVTALEGWKGDLEQLEDALAQLKATGSIAPSVDVSTMAPDAAPTISSPSGSLNPGTGAPM